MDSKIMKEDSEKMSTEVQRNGSRIKKESITEYSSSDSSDSDDSSGQSSGSDSSLSSHTSDRIKKTHKNRHSGSSDSPEKDSPQKLSDIFSKDQLRIKKETHENSEVENPRSRLDTSTESTTSDRVVESESTNSRKKDRENYKLSKSGRGDKGNNVGIGDKTDCMPHSLSKNGASEIRIKDTHGSQRKDEKGVEQESQPTDHDVPECSSAEVAAETSMNWPKYDSSDPEDSERSQRASLKDRRKKSKHSPDVNKERTSRSKEHSKKSKYVSDDSEDDRHSRKSKKSRKHSSDSEDDQHNHRSRNEVRKRRHKSNSSESEREQISRSDYSRKKRRHSSSPKRSYEEEYYYRSNKSPHAPRHDMSRFESESDSDISPRSKDRRLRTSKPMKSSVRHAHEGSYSRRDRKEGVQDHGDDPNYPYSDDDGYTVRSSDKRRKNYERGERYDPEYRSGGRRDASSKGYDETDRRRDRYQRGDMRTRNERENFYEQDENEYQQRGRGRNQSYDEIDGRERRQRYYDRRNELQEEGENRQRNFRDDRGIDSRNEEQRDYNNSQRNVEETERKRKGDKLDQAESKQVDRNSETAGKDGPTEEPTAKKAKKDGPEMLTSKTGGAYIPPAKLRMMQQQITDKSSDAYQRMSWEALKKSINGLVNKVNVSNLLDIVKELLQENLVRGRGLLSRSIIQAQSASPTFTHVYGALVAVINSKFPQIGELILKRLIVQFKRGYRRNDKTMCLSSTRFLAHMVNQNICHEVLSLEILTLLLENPTDHSVEIAVGFLKECGQKLTEVSPRGINAIFDRLRTVLNEGMIDKRVQYMVEVMYAVRKDGFKDHKAVIDDLDVLEEDAQITHLLTLEDATNTEDILNIFRSDPNFLENEEKYKVLKKEMLDEDSTDEEGESSSGSDDETEVDSDEEEAKQTIIDSTETNLVAFRRTIYLTIQSSLDFEECVHKLLKMQIKPGQETELCNMILDCCAQQRTYEKYFGLLAQRFCQLNKKYIEPYQFIFREQYDTIHKLETNKVRNVAKFFSHLLHTDAISWGVLSCISLNEDDTNSASRIFIKILFQELSEYMGLPKLNARLKDVTLQSYFEGILPRDNPKNTRFAINFFTTIGLGGLTDDLREHLKNLPKPVPQQQENSESSSEDSSSDSDNDPSASSSSTSSSSSSSDSDSESSSDEEDEMQKNKSSQKRSKIAHRERIQNGYVSPDKQEQKRRKHLSRSHSGSVENEMRNSTREKDRKKYRNEEIYETDSYRNSLNQESYKNSSRQKSHRTDYPEMDLRLSEEHRHKSSRSKYSNERERERNPDYDSRDFQKNGVDEERLAYSRDNRSQQYRVEDDREFVGDDIYSRKQRHDKYESRRYDEHSDEYKKRYDESIDKYSQRRGDRNREYETSEYYSEDRRKTNSDRNKNYNQYSQSSNRTSRLVDYEPSPEQIERDRKRDRSRDRRRR